MDDVAPEVAYQTYRIRDMLPDERPRERLRHRGAAALAHHELLAILLRTGTESESVVAVAQRLVHHFGGLAGLARATLTELTTLRGVGPAKATELQAAFELGRRVSALSPEDRPVITSAREAAALVGSDMALLEQEEFRVLLLSRRNHLLRAVTLYRGTIHSAPLRLAEVFRAALRENAAAVILVHNHPSGDPTPSRADIAATEQAVKAGELLGVDVLDHVIIVRGDHLSMRDRGLGF